MKKYLVLVLMLLAATIPLNAPSNAQTDAVCEVAVLSGQDAAGDVRFSADRSQLYYRTLDANLNLIDLATGDRRPMTAFSEESLRQYYPAGPALVVVQLAGFTVWAVPTDTSIAPLQIAANRAFVEYVDPDGAFVVVSERRSDDTIRLMLVDLIATNFETRVVARQEITSGEPYTTGITFYVGPTPTGKGVFFWEGTSSDSSLRVFDLQTNSTTTLLTVPIVDTYPTYILEGSTGMAFTLQMGERVSLFVWPFSNEREPVELTADLRYLDGSPRLPIQLTPDGRYVVYHAVSGITDRATLFAAPVDGSLPPEVMTANISQDCLDYGPCGSFRALNNGAIWLGASDDAPIQMYFTDYLGNDPLFLRNSARGVYEVVGDLVIDLEVVSVQAGEDRAGVFQFVAQPLDGGDAAPLGAPFYWRGETTEPEFYIYGDYLIYAAAQDDDRAADFRYDLVRVNLRTGDWIVVTEDFTPNPIVGSPVLSFDGGETIYFPQWFEGHERFGRVAVATCGG